MLTKLLQTHIRKLNFTLKSEEELNLVLKAKLTKKEYKLFHALAKELPSDETLQTLKLTTAEYEEATRKLVKKLNQEKFKQALYTV